MPLFYDRDYGHNWNRGYDRGYRSQSGWGDFNRDTPRGHDRYDRGYKSRWQTDYGDPFNDRTSRTPMRMTRGEYRGPDDRNYGGDYPGRGPRGFGGDYRGTNERNFGWESNYDRDYSANPMGYDPYFDQSNRGPTNDRWNRYDRGFRARNRGYGGGMGRGYDQGWF